MSTKGGWTPSRDKRGPSRWAFFIDESGDFNDPDECVVVGGLLVDEDLAGLEPGKLERTLRQVAPLLPWPLHTAHVNLPVTFALEARLQREGSEGSATGAVLDETQDLSAKCIDALRDGAWPQYEDLKALDSHLRARARREHSRWARRRTEVHAAIGAVLEGLVAASTVPRAAVITCSESSPADAAANSKERYLPLLQHALERAMWVAGLHEGEHEIRIHALSRHVVDPTIGQKIFLSKRHLGHSINSVAPVQRVRAIVHEVVDFRDGVHPGLFCADFICNRARPRLESSLRSLLDVETDVATATRAPVRTKERSHLAASGAARAYLRAAKADRAMPTPLGVDMKRWAQEQAREWAETDHG